ncbi:hypothetical protein BGX31_000307, partial [Mortierella sp. GBA43]
MCSEIAAELIHDSGKACNQNGLDHGSQKYKAMDQLKLVDTVTRFPASHPTLSGLRR